MRNWIPCLLAAALAALLATPAGAGAPPPPPAYYAPGCDGPGQAIDDTGAMLPGGTTWCGCDGRTLESFHMNPPAGVRVRFQGACVAEVRVETQPELSERGRRTGRTIVWLEANGGLMEVGRFASRCRARPAPGRLPLLWLVDCGRQALQVTREADGLVVRGPGGVLVRQPLPGAQAVRLP